MIELQCHCSIILYSDDEICSTGVRNKKKNHRFKDEDGTEIYVK